MKLPITIEYTNGKQSTYVAQPPEWVKWELKTGNTISQAQEKIGLHDLLFLAYHAMKRETAGATPIKPFEVWCETVLDVIVGEANPKAIQSEASAEQSGNQQQLLEFRRQSFNRLKIYKQ